VDARVVDATGVVDASSLASSLATTPFDACFHAPGAAAASAATALWGPARAGPPFFIRPRARPTLADDPEAAWVEVAGQNWRAAGLLAGLDPDTSAAAEREEALLVVVGGQGEGGSSGGDSGGSAEAFLAVAGLQASPGGVTAVRLDGWTGDGVAPIPPWRTLRPRVEGGGE
jgi:hypothetical protein